MATSQVRGRSGRTSSLTAGDTRSRLLAAALRTFSRRGYRAATLREICAAAGVNGAAVNYHFHSKHDLYLATVHAACRSLHAERPLPEAVEAGGDPAAARARLRATIASLARGVLEAEEGDAALLLMRELRRPTDAFEIVMHEYVRPRFAAMHAAVQPFVAERAPRAGRLATLSVLAQIAYYRLASPAALQLLRAERWDDALIDEVVMHITGFSERALGVEP